jgi:hypothetical protein
MIRVSFEIRRQRYDEQIAFCKLFRKKFKKNAFFLNFPIAERVKIAELHICVGSFLIPVSA